MVAAGVIGGLYILCAVILSVGVREKRGEAAGVRGGTGVLEEGCCTDPAGEAKSEASHSGSLGPGGGGDRQRWGLPGDLGRLCRVAALRAGAQSIPGMLQHGPEDLALCAGR